MAQTITPEERQHKTAQLLKLLDELVGTASRDEDKALMSQLNSALRAARTKAAQRDMADIHVGQRVTFTGKYGRKVTGTVERINTKTVTIKDTDDGNPAGWRVSPGSLTPVTA